MEKLTITEALSELNLIKKKSEKKKAVVMGLLVKAKNLPDPFPEQGSKEYIRSEVQAMDDLNARFIRIKGAIAKANIDNKIKVNDQEKTIHDWLIWKRDISKNEMSFSTEVYRTVKNHFDALQKQPQVYKGEDGSPKLVEYESMVDQGTFLKKSENLQEIFEKLDGQLSLKNATIVLDV
jgi:hypothetical protein